MLITERFIKKLIHNVLMEHLLTEDEDLDLRDLPDNFKQNIITILSFFEKPNKIWSSKIVAKENKKIAEINFNDFLEAYDSEGDAGNFEKHIEILHNFKVNYPADIFLEHLMSAQGKNFRDKFIKLSEHKVLTSDDKFVRTIAEIILKIYMTKHPAAKENPSAMAREMINTRAQHMKNDYNQNKTNSYLSRGMKNVKPSNPDFAQDKPMRGVDNKFQRMDNNLKLIKKRKNSTDDMISDR